MTHPQILDATEMVTPRNPDDLYAWVIRKCEELSESTEAKAYARSGAILPKKFYDEIFPLAVFAQREYRGRTDVLIQPCLGNDNFDATVAFTGGNARIVFIETTYAKQGYDESLRMEALAKDGYVFLTGAISRTGKRGTPSRTVTVTPEAVHRRDQLTDYLALLRTRLEAKSNKQYGANHVLLVAVDDYLPLAEDYYWPVVDQHLRLWISDLALDFGHIVFVGVAGKLFLSYSLPLQRDPTPIP